MANPSSIVYAATPIQPPIQRAAVVNEDGSWSVVGFQQQQQLWAALQGKNGLLELSFTGAGLATLVNGYAAIAYPRITARSRIVLCPQDVGSGTVSTVPQAVRVEGTRFIPESPGSVRVGGRTAGVGFLILSTSATDTSDIAWFVNEPLYA